MLRPKILEMQLTYLEVGAKYVMRQILSVFLGGRECNALHQVLIPFYLDGNMAVISNLNQFVPSKRYNFPYFMKISF